MLAIVTLCETLNPEQTALLKQIFSAMEILYEDREALRVQVQNLTNEKTGRDIRIAELNARLDGAIHSIETYVEENESLRKQMFDLSSSIAEFQKAEKLMAEQHEILSGAEISEVLSGFPSDWDALPKEELGFREAFKLRIVLNPHDSETPWWVDGVGASGTFAVDDAEFAELMANCLEAGDTYKFENKALQEMAEKVAWNKLATGKNVKLVEMLREYWRAVDMVSQAWSTNRGSANTWEDEFRHNSDLCMKRSSIEMFLTYAYNEPEEVMRLAAETQALVDTSPSIANALPCEELGFADPQPQLFGESSYPAHSEGVVTETLEEDDGNDCWYVPLADSKEVAATDATTEIQNVESCLEEVAESIKRKLRRQCLQSMFDDMNDAPGEHSEVDPPNQVRPADQCHEEDHKAESSENEAAQPILPTCKVTYMGVDTETVSDIWRVERNGTIENMKNSQLARMLMGMNPVYIQWGKGHLQGGAQWVHWQLINYKEAVNKVERLASQYTHRNQRGE